MFEIYEIRDKPYIRLKLAACCPVKVLRESTQTPQPVGCSCCPVQGGCEDSGIVYQASVVENQSGKTETYTGLTARKFKKRWQEHNTDFEQNQDHIKFTCLGTKGQGGGIYNQLENP